MGALYGGTVLEYYGYQGIFISMAIFSMLCAILYYPIQAILIQKHCKKRNQYLTYEKNVDFFEQLEQRETYL